MSPPPSPPQPSPPQRSPHFGDRTVLSLLISALVLLVALIAMRPRFSQGRLLVDQLHDLTAEEVSLLPEGTIPVVLGRAGGETNTNFKIQLLRLVMQRSGVPHAIGLTSSALTQDAAVDALATGAIGGVENPQAITVGVYGAGPALNARLRAIPIPITGGLLGLRVGWTHRNRLAALAAVQNRDDLSRLTLLQGQGWSELEIFDQAGLRTFASPLPNLFRLVSEQRVDLFPQGVADVQSQEGTAKTWSKSLVMDPHLLIAYPFAGFFYVNQGNEALAVAIERGFERALADGSYQELLERVVITPWLKERLNLTQRTVIVLPNPDAAELLAQVQSSHWIVPWDDLVDGRVRAGEQLCELPQIQALCP